MIACSPSHYGSDMIIVETQEIGLGIHVNSNEFYLGTKVEIEKLSILRINGIEIYKMCTQTSTH